MKKYFYRQYGLKSIAVKNLANLAAGVRKEEASVVRLRLFGALSGSKDTSSKETSSKDTSRKRHPLSAFACSALFLVTSIVL